ncbi:AraC family transcriptional regulator [Sutcliffiella horikoshii]|uniref:AraC family transcriptional regulator n=1 Tax=Sutcliffiella horikoshii TaxID=79883 RepID=UPI00203BA2A9|nr:helix-turn-helix domain-containing protein [Sutcliffiella horikoshii]MCM3618117.1 AraC family transcriptional regulator [Sutcliffiella horikoshii]
MYTSEHEKLMDQVMEYIEKNLESSLSLEKLASISTYSPFHFQRIFKGLVGESPTAYVKRLRMEKAAHLLIYEYELPVTQIALICGFSSLSYFTTSFQSYFKFSPTKWREGAYLERFPREYDNNSKKSKQLSNKEQEQQTNIGYNKFQWLDLEKVKIMEFPVCTTVKKQNVGPYTEGIPNVWEAMYHWGKARDLITDTSFMFGVPKNNPYITPPELSRYECHLAVEGIIDENLVTYPYKGGKYVVYEFEEPVDYLDRSKLIECYSELYSFWLPKSGYKYLDNPLELLYMAPKKGGLEVDFKVRAIALAIEPK